MKKGKGGNKVFQGKESFMRMSFLYQASHMILTQSNMDKDLSAYYGRLMSSVAQKSVLKMEPMLKREFCKGCCYLLIPRISVRVRIRSGNIIFTCLRCGTIKRFPTNRGYKLWIQNKEACLELLEVPNCVESTSYPADHRYVLNVKEGDASEVKEDNRILAPSLNNV